MDPAAPADDVATPRHQRRAPRSRLYTRDELLGRTPLRLRRRSDKVRLMVHVGAVLAMVALAAWWTLPLHGFAGPVLVVIAPGRGLHLGDVPALAFVGVALRSLLIAGRIARTPPP